MALVRVTPPAVAPLTLAQLQGQLRDPSSAEDAVLNALCAAAGARFDGPDGVLGRALITQTLRLDLADWPGEGGVRLPMPPFGAVTHVKYYPAGSATLSTLDTAAYRVVAGDQSSWWYTVDGADTPSLEPRPDAVQITYTAGYGAAADAVPAAITQAMLLWAGSLYGYRGDNGAEGMAAVEAAAIALCAPYRVRAWE